MALCLAATAGMVRDMSADTARMAALAGSGFATATDLADWLVRVLGMPFRDAHHVTGRLVALAEAQGAGSRASLTLAEMQGVEPRITARDFCRADGGGLGRLAHQLWRHRAGECREGGGKMAGAAGMRYLLDRTAAVPGTGRLRPARRADPAGPGRGYHLPAHLSGAITWRLPTRTGPDPEPARAAGRAPGFCDACAGRAVLRGRAAERHRGCVWHAGLGLWRRHASARAIAAPDRRRSRRPGWRCISITP